MDDSAKNYEVLEAFVLNEGETELEVGQHVDLTDAQADALVAEGKVKLVEQEEEAAEEAAEEEAA